ncbi:S-methyl-5'-thioadenosine phosphorylase [Methanobrevibacter cuticularis]|uniref:Probable S-methyl-5'-thioinosine phosphorylase n=1 Tax=Methanobrevibacter cuticularis TaxID=47311 RepID=A0A166CP94_9EURY|nr:S-methyl-5'-thioadenosine phosphorylase [Methanobrevibacter cuticularis]KZX14719.1 S-methyl-5'-thioadenosine phosphorylase [Methanobrevibacter cuticularis]
MFGIIGGSGIYDIVKDAGSVEKRIIETPYGDSSEISIFEIYDKEVAFMPRHSGDHSFPPHKINYRANIWALATLNVKQIIATNAVGSLKREIPPGSLVLVSDFMDFTSKREKTFYDNEVIHVDVTEPYCNRLRSHIIASSDTISTTDFIAKGVYVGTEGPRFESPAEVRMFQKLGGDVVGMTGLPEAVLAKEKEICYSSICLVSNYAASISPNKLTMDEVIEIMDIKKLEIIDLIYKTIENIPVEYDCVCLDALDGAGA